MGIGDEECGEGEVSEDRRETGEEVEEGEGG